MRKANACAVPVWLVFLFIHLSLLSFTYAYVLGIKNYISEQPKIKYKKYINLSDFIEKITF
jgi:hypothetical protein